MAASTRHVEHCMGTTFSVDVRDPGDWDAAVAAVVDWLHHVDRTFSTYRLDSVVSRLGRGELALDAAPADVREVLAACERLTVQSDGYFSATAAGRLDPSGLVKGWAIERASDLLRAHGSANHAVNGGGDMQLAGEAAPGRPWRVGIADPLRRDRLLTVLAGRDIAVATSGTAERGAHVVDPWSGRPATELRSVTVVGERLSTVDAHATAALAMGHRAQAWLEALPGHEALAVGRRGERWRTSGFAAHVAEPVVEPRPADSQPAPRPVASRAATVKP